MSGEMSDLVVAAHRPVTIGATANGLSLDVQKLSLAAATASTPGAMGAEDKSKLDGLSGSNSGDVTLTAVGSSPSANGASLSGQALTLQPADATHPGLVTAGAQGLAGAKTFSDPITAPYFVPAALYPGSIATGLVADVYWNGTELVDALSNSWSMQGTVPQVAATPNLWPAGAGPFSVANYYSAGDALDQTSDFTVCVVFDNTTLYIQQVLVGKDSSGQRQWSLVMNASNQVVFTVYKAGGGSSTQTIAVALGMHCIVASYSYVADGTSIILFARENALTSILTAVGPPVDVTANLQIGITESVQSPWLGTIHRVSMWNRALSAKEATGITNQARQMWWF